MPLKVLTVDDSRTIRIIVKKAFRPFDVEVVEAENGRDGLELAKKEKPDLIVLDITMPVMTGIEMLNKLKDEPDLKNIPVIMLTAESGKENVMQIIQMGVSNYIVKPFKGEQLIERAKTIVTLDLKKEDGESGKPAKPAGSFQLMTIPEKIARPMIAEFDSAVNEMPSVGRNQLILDISKVAEINVLLVKLLLTVFQTCEKRRITLRVVGSSTQRNDLKHLKETSHIMIWDSVEKAKGSF